MEVALFKSVEAFLGANPPGTTELYRSGCETSRSKRLRAARTASRGSRRYAYCFHYRPWRYPDVGEGHEAGAIEFLSKPFREQELLDAVRQGIERHRARAAQRRAWAQIHERFAGLTDRERKS